MNTDQYDEFQSLRIPPHSIDAEQSVLGGLLLDSSAFSKVSALISDSDFYREDHRFIFQSIAARIADDKPIDWITLSEWLKDNGKLDQAGGSTYLGTLAKDTPSAANIVAYAEIVKDKSILRGLISVGTMIQEEAYISDGLTAVEKLASAQDSVIHLNQNFKENKSKMSTPKDILADIFSDWNKQQESTEDTLLGLSYGLKQLDEMTQGMEGGQLIVVGARPAMGKTAFQMLLESTSLDKGVPVASISMEMPDKQLMQRQISRRSLIPLNKIKNSRMMNESDWAMASQASKTLKEQPYFIDDTSAQSPQGIRDSVTAMNAKSIKDHGKPLGLVVVDYLQLMTTDKSSKAGNRTEEVGQFSGALKSIAKDFNIPVVALSQLNRNLESRPDKRPVMSDLRESGAIEQDADIIMFIYRDEVYNEDSDDIGVGEIIIGKQRSGPIGTVRAGFDGACTRWHDMAEDFYHG